MATITNKTVNNATTTNQENGSSATTWDEADFTWDSAVGTWDNPYQFVNDDVNAATVATQSLNG